MLHKWSWLIWWSSTSGISLTPTSHPSHVPSNPPPNDPVGQETELNWKYLWKSPYFVTHCQPFLTWWKAVSAHQGCVAGQGTWDLIRKPVFLSHIFHLWKCSGLATYCQNSWRISWQSSKLAFTRPGFDYPNLLTGSSISLFGKVLQFVSDSFPGLEYQLGVNNF